MDKTEKLKSIIESYLSDWDSFIVTVENDDDEDNWIVTVASSDFDVWCDVFYIHWGRTTQCRIDDNNDFENYDTWDFVICSAGEEHKLTELNFWRVSRFTEATK